MIIKKTKEGKKVRYQQELINSKRNTLVIQAGCIKREVLRGKYLRTTAEINMRRRR